MYINRIEEKVDRALKVLKDRYVYNVVKFNQELLFYTEHFKLCLSFESAKYSITGVSDVKLLSVIKHVEFQYNGHEFQDHADCFYILTLYYENGSKSKLNITLCNTQNKVNESGERIYHDVKIGIL